jgi:hypothetical protein
MISNSQFQAKSQMGFLAILWKNNMPTRPANVDKVGRFAADSGQTAALVTWAVVFTCSHSPSSSISW